jgi:hypothetical protein
LDRLVRMARIAGGGAAVVGLFGQVEESKMQQVKERKASLSWAQVEQRLNLRGYKIVEKTGQPGFQDRKGRVYWVVDRRDGRVALQTCLASRIESWSKEQGWPAI